jgi:hypothetical protein
VQARLRPILATSGIPDLDRLVDRISAEPNGPLGDEVVEAMTTNETLFFRDLHPFTDLAEQVVPRLVASRPKGTTLRFWSAAASFGQEAYTLAMVLTELRWMLGDGRGRPPTPISRCSAACPRPAARPTCTAAASTGGSTTLCAPWPASGSSTC